MKKCWFVIIALLVTTLSPAQTGWRGVLSSMLKTGQALTLTDEELAETVQEAVNKMDKENKVCASNNAYSKRLRKLTDNMTDAEGIDLNFKVYQTEDLNAFACPDGSVRVFSA